MNRYYTARVHDNNDPEKRGRLMLEIAGLLDTTGEDAIWPDWIEPKVSGGVGVGSAGLFWIPPNDAIVVVETEIRGGEVPDLRWSGGTTGNKNTIPNFLLSNYPRRAGWSSPSGNAVIVLDNDTGHYVLVDDENAPNGAKNYLTIGRNGTIQASTASGSVLQINDANTLLLSKEGHTIQIDNDDSAIKLIHKDGTELITLESGVVKINGTAIQLGGGMIELTNGSTAGVHPYFLSTTFLTDLSALITFILAVNTAIPTSLSVPVVTPATDMITRIATSLASGAPYLSTLIKGN